MNNIDKIIVIALLSLGLIGCGKTGENNQSWALGKEDVEAYDIDGFVSQISEGRVWVSYDCNTHYALIDMLGNVAYSTIVAPGTPNYDPMVTPVHNGSTVVHAEPGLYIWLDADGNELYRLEGSDELEYEVLGAYGGNYFIREKINNINENRTSCFIMNGNGDRKASIDDIDDFSNPNDYIYIGYQYNSDYLVVFNLKT